MDTSDRKNKQERRQYSQKQKQIFKQKFSKTLKVVLESDTTTIQKPQNIRDLMHEKNKTINDQKPFSESESTTPSAIKVNAGKKVHTFVCQ